jgi:hypothetical protein
MERHLKITKCCERGTSDCFRKPQRSIESKVDEALSLLRSLFREQTVGDTYSRFEAEMQSFHLPHPITYSGDDSDGIHYMNIAGS